jgi:O-acetylhomoserine (thiol)-lyase
LGLETLNLRFKQVSTATLELAKFLQTLPQIKQVAYTGLPDSPFYAIAREQFGESQGAMLTFALADRAACYAFMNRLKLIRRATNLFDNKSLIIHPLSTIYGTLSPEMKKVVEVPDDLMRLSVGLEAIEDLQADILQALG